MSQLPAWSQLYAAYDADSLSTFASAGLLRRAHKDIDARKVNLLADTGDHLQFENDDQHIRLDDKGIQNARCSCPAQGCCKHILAAVLWLQHQGLQNQQSPHQAQAETSPSPQEHTAATKAVDSKAAISPDQAGPGPGHTALDALLSMQPDIVLKGFNKPTIRLAHQFQQLWQMQSPSIQLDNQDSRLKLVLPPEPLGAGQTVLFIAGAGVQGMLSEIESKYQQAAHLAAVAELFRLHDKVWDWGGMLASQPEQVKDGLNEPEQQIVQQVQHLIEQFICLGLSHLDKASAKQCRLLNMSARAEGLLLLAAYLRTLHGNLESLITGDEHSDEKQVLLQLAFLYAYCYQLQHSQGETFRSKLGRSRQTYLPSEQQVLNLQPVGAHWWQTPGGARGLTLSFWDIEAAQLVETILARPNASDPNFYPSTVWQQHAVWKRSPQQLMKQAFALRQPRFSEDGRLASSGDSDTNPLGSLTAAQRVSIGITDWQQLQQQLLQHSLNGDNTLPVRYLLRIKSYEALQVDELEQCVWWRVQDQQDTTLHLRLDWHADNMARIEQLELLCQQQRPIQAVLVQSEPAASSWFMLQPLSVLIAEDDDNWCVFNLDFDHAEPRSASRFVAASMNIVGRIKQLLQRKQQQLHQQSLLTQQTLAQKITEPVLHILESMSASGRLLLTSSQQQQLIQQVELAQQAGLECLAGPSRLLLDQPAIAAVHVLKLAYLCQHIQHMQRRLLMVASIH